MSSMEEVAAGRRPTGWLVGWKTLFVSCGLLMACNLFLWVWDYNFAFTAGLDSSSRAFALHYRTLFWGELLSVGSLRRPVVRMAGADGPRPRQANR